MKKIAACTIALALAWVGLAQAGPHPHGPFPVSKPSGKAHQAHHNPHKPGPASFRAALVHPEPK